MAILHFWNGGHKPDDLAPGEYGFSSHGILDDTGWHPPGTAARGQIEIPDARILAGSYAQVLQELAQPGGHVASSALVIAGENNRELETFLAALGERGVAHGYAGGVAAYPQGSSRGELHPAGTECILILAGGSTVSHNLHHSAETALEIVTEGERSVVTIESVPAAEYYRDARMGKYAESDFEHLTLSDRDGRNVHLSPDADDPGRLRSGAAMPSGPAYLREIPRIVEDLERTIAHGELAFCCAGLGGALERPPKATTTIGVWMFGEIVDLGNGPRLGNLMISAWSRKR